MKTFEDIVSGNTPSHKVWEDDHHIAFLNPRPIQRGHVIVIPKKLEGYLFDMQPQDYHALWEAARTVAEILRARLHCERVCVAVVGWEVRHAHVHLVPTNKSGDFPSLPGKEASAEELGKIASEIAPRDASTNTHHKKAAPKRP
jgi:histidine triad (HIT) family protein